MSKPVPPWVQSDVDVAQSLVGRTITAVDAPPDTHGVKELRLTLDDGRTITLKPEGYEADAIGLYDDTPRVGS